MSSRQATLSINRTQELRMPIALSSAQAQTSLLKMLSNVRGYLITGDSEFRQHYQESRHEFEHNLQQMKQLFQQWNVPIQLEQLQTLEALYDVWLDLPPHLFELKDNPVESQPAFRIWKEETQVPALEILADLRSIISEQESQWQSRSARDIFQILEEFQVSFSLLLSDLESYIVTRQDSYQFNYTAYYRQSKENLAQLQSLQNDLSPSQQEKLQRILERFDIIEQKAREMLEIVNSDRYREDLYIYQTQVEPIADQMLVILAYTVESQENQLTSELRQGIQGLNLAQLQTLIGAIFTLAVGIAMTIILRQKIADPVQRLTTIAEEVSAGNLEVKARVESTDEIGILAQTFNQMTVSLSQSLRELEEYSKNLEDIVQERTEELQIKNDELQDTLANLKETQSHLIQAEKMSSLGQMVAGIAHEINNPVSFIHGNLVPLMEYCQDLFDLIDIYRTHCPKQTEAEGKIEAIDLDYLKEDLPKILEAMNIGTERIHDIVLSLKNFSRLGESDLKEADIHEGLESTLLILQHRLNNAAKQGCEIVLEKKYGRLPLVKCYPGQLNQVFMNILANGIEVLELHPDFDYSEGKKPTLNICTEYVKNESKVRIFIRDNGPGIEPEHAGRIFDPFFTTKPVGKGTGLGLSISYNIIVDNHQGILRCDSQPGSGATFFIEIPVRDTLEMNSNSSSQV
ncbi:ATP-binding protein [Roseofilum casamattae]|uniref:histidine kinase n=1 Tax=Roseofilum casamattae BLCC-M143 TaxID=3022442 RepID=A0ABT7BU80_9CYAN|nr:ATP-binding protein [Roseofilum casamattae]MDJ1182745.1 ATP-binding protein [Roseofilum casamattae BLCC-M143]